MTTALRVRNSVTDSYAANAVSAQRKFSAYNNDHQQVPVGSWRVRHSPYVLAFLNRIEKLTYTSGSAPDLPNYVCEQGPFFVRHPQCGLSCIIKQATVKNLLCLLDSSEMSEYLNMASSRLSLAIHFSIQTLSISLRHWAIIRNDRTQSSANDGDRHPAPPYLCGLAGFHKFTGSFQASRTHAVITIKADSK